jgi:hypothetical protein
VPGVRTGTCRFLLSFDLRTGESCQFPGFSTAQGARRPQKVSPETTQDYTQLNDRKWQIAGVTDGEFANSITFPGCVDRLGFKRLSLVVETVKSRSGN